MFAIEMQNITKSFGGTFKANDSVNFKVKTGEIHALVGENGAGKSTLMKILYGMYHPDSGKILINGTEQNITSSHKAISLGIGMVHQHFMLVDTLTVLENIILGAEPTKLFGLIDYSVAEDKIKHISEKFNITIHPNTKVETLPVGIQQKIEILKLLYREADILILDEPTAVLTPQETEELFVTLKELKNSGKTIILITHKLGEVLSVSDSVTVLRHGRVTGSVKTSGLDTNTLTKMIVGEDLKSHENKIAKPGENRVLSVKNLTVLNTRKSEALHNISFDINSGEILGLAGVEGNGQTELIEALNGLREISSGEIKINSIPVNNSTEIAHIPADRHKYGIVMDYSISDNVILGREDETKFSSPFKLKQRDINKYSEKLMTEYDVRISSISQRIKGLSGGNQQKVVAARELDKKTELIIACHPTRGLDIKASEYVRQQLLTEAAKGRAVFVVSSDLSELLKISDRIAVIYNGRITAILESGKTNENEIGFYMTGLKEN